MTVKQQQRPLVSAAHELSDTAGIGEVGCLVWIFLSCTAFTETGSCEKEITFSL